MKPPKEIFLASLTFFYAITISLILFGYEPVSSRPHSKRASFYIANETVCVVDDIIYHNSDPIPSDDPCETCKCRPPGFACVLRKCEVKPGCKAVRKEGECCPQYVCGCEHNGVIYKNGDVIRNTESPCYTCYCQGSSIACALVDCYFRHDCAPKYVPGECCPRYDDCPTEKTPIPPSSNETVSTTSILPVTYTYAPRTAPSHSYSSGEERRPDQQVIFNEVPIDQLVVYADGDAVSAITSVHVEESTSIHVNSEPASTKSPSYDNDVLASETPLKLADFSHTSTLPDKANESELSEATTKAVFLSNESSTDETSSRGASTLEDFTPTPEIEDQNNSTTNSPLIELKILLSNISTLSDGSDPELSTIRIEDETKTTTSPIKLTSSSSESQTQEEKDVDIILDSKDHLSTIQSIINPITKQDFASTTEQPNSIENNLNEYLGPIISDVDDIGVKSGGSLDGERMVTQTDTSTPVVSAISELESHEVDKEVDKEPRTTVTSLDITISSQTSTFDTVNDLSNLSKESTTEVVVSPDQAGVTEDSAKGNVVEVEKKASVNKVESVFTTLVPDVANITDENEQVNDQVVKIGEEILLKITDKNQSLEDNAKNDEVTVETIKDEDEEIGQKEKATTEKVELFGSDGQTKKVIEETTTILPLRLMENGETPLKLSTLTSLKEDQYNLYNNNDFTTKDSSSDATTIANTLPEAVGDKELSESTEKQSSTTNPIFGTEPSSKELHSESEKKYIYHFIHRSGSYDHFAPELRGSVKLSETDNVGVPIGYSNDFALDIRSLMASEMNTLEPFPSSSSSSTQDTSETTTQQIKTQQNDEKTEMKPVEIDLAVVEDRLEELKKESLSKTTETVDLTTTPLPIGIKRYVEHTTGEIELSHTSSIKYQRVTSEMTPHFEESSTESASASSEEHSEDNKHIEKSESSSEHQSILGQVTTESDKALNTAPTNSKDINNLPTTISAQLYHDQEKHEPTHLNLSESAVNSTELLLDGTTVSTVLENKHTNIESKNDETKIVTLMNSEKIDTSTILPSIRDKVTTTDQLSSFPSITESKDSESIDDKTTEVSTFSDTSTKQSTTWQTIKSIFNDLTTAPSIEYTSK